MNWVEVTPEVFKGYVTHMTKLPCSCHLYFYYGTHSVPEAKMLRRKAKYYIDSIVLQSG